MQHAHFRDVTNMLATFKDDIASGELARLMRALNDTCFPQVRCPMGCYVYVDDEVGEKLQLLPASHYLASMIPSFVSFGAQADYFQGARSDWIIPIVDLDRIVSPSLIVDKEHGLCILMCSSKKHSDGRKPFFHVPTHPVVGWNAPPAPYYLAPAVVTGNVVRTGTSNVYNTSFPVFLQQGSSRGLSTVRLSTRHPRFQMTDNLAICSGFTLNQRSDILHYAMQTVHFEENAIVDTLQRYQQQKPTDQVIQSCSAASTFIDLDDACLLSNVYNFERGENDVMPLEGDGRGNAANPRDCLFIMHPNNCNGHRPFHILRGHALAVNADLPMNWLLYATLQSFLHVRLLHTCLLRRVWEQRPNQQLHRQMLDVCKLFVNSKNITRMPVKRATLIELSAALSRLPEGLDAEDTLARVLKHLCPGIECRRIVNDCQFPERDGIDAGLLVVTRQ